MNTKMALLTGLHLNKTFRIAQLKDFPVMWTHVTCRIRIMLYFGDEFLSIIEESIIFNRYLESVALQFDKNVTKIYEAGRFLIANQCSTEPANWSYIFRVIINFIWKIVFLIWKTQTKFDQV